MERHRLSPAVLVISGPSLLRELTYKNTLLGRTLDNVTPASALNTLLSGSGWATNTVDAGLNNLTARFDGVPLWKAIAELANINNVHVREVIPRKIDYGAFGVASGVVLMNLEAVSPNLPDNTLVGLVQSVKVTEDGQTIINSIVPLGAGEGSNQFALGDQNAAGASPHTWSTRTTPYTIQTGTGPNGKAYYYLEDAASVTAYGRRQKVLASKQTVAIANSPTAFENAANALYDLGATYLARFKDPLTIYDVTVSELAPGFSVGDTIRFIYRGVAEDSVTSRRTWLNVDSNLVVLDRTRTFNQDGGYTWSLKLASLARWQMDDQQILIGALETLDVFRTGVKFYTYNISHGSERESIVTGHNFDYSIFYDANVSRLLKCSLSVRFKVLKSNVSVVGNEGAHTHTVTIGTHTHTIGYTSTTPSGTSISVASTAHHHKVGGIPNPPTANPAGFGPMEFNSGDGAGHIGVYVGTATPYDLWTGAPNAFEATNASGVDHTHGVPGGTTSGSGGSSTPTSAAGTSHTHALTYGIFEASTPTVFTSLSAYINGTDRSVALGGPWNAGTGLTLDVTQYLVDASGHPLRQENIVQFRTAGAVAYDVIAHATSLLAASAIEAA